MANKTLKTRIINKHDTEANWKKATNFIPKKGEIIIYDKDGTHLTPRFKVGDGETLVSSLPFVNEVDLSNYVTESELTAHTSNTSNPHSVTKAQIGLSSVVNAGQTATPTSGSNSYFTAGGAYTLKQSIDAKADEDEVVKINVNIGRGNTNSSAPVIVGGQIDTHPENNGLVLTYMMNDLAFLLSRGGSCILKNTTNNKTLTGSANLFDCAPTYMQLNGFLSSQSDIVEVWVKSPTTYTYNTNFGIGFGSNNWRAKNIKIEAGYSATNRGTAQNPDTDIKWKTITNITNYNLGVVNVGSSGPGTAQGGTSDYKWSYLKYTLTNWANINPRIAQIWTVYYSSKGLASGYVSRGGGDIYGSVNIKSTLTANQINWDGTQLTNQDLDDYTSTTSSIGRYWAGGNNSVANKPSGVDSFGMEVIRTATGVITEILYGHVASDNNSVHMYMRRYYSAAGGWEEWKELLTSASLGNHLTYEDLGTI